MKKSDLLALSIPPLPKSRKDAIYRAQSVQYIMRSGFSPDMRILIVAFYSPQSAANGFSMPCAVLYQSKEDYTTQVIVDGACKWRDSKLFCALKINRSQDAICMTAADERRIVSFLKKCGFCRNRHPYLKDHDIPTFIERYQSDILEKRLSIRKQRAADAVDKKMKEVPSLPKSFDAWIDRWPLLQSRYGYYKRVGKNDAECFCTHCKGDFFMRKTLASPLPAHNAKGRCPLCKSEITFKARGKTTKLFDNTDISILQRTKNDDMLLRFFYLTRDFLSHYRSPETSYEEKGRLFFSADGQILAQFKYGWSAKTHRIGWYPTKDTLTGDPKHIKFTIKIGMYQEVWNVWFRLSYLYHYNLHAMLTRLNLSYDIKQMVKGHSIDVTSCILRSMVYPFAPSLHRIGLSQVREDLLNNYINPLPSVTSGPLHVRWGVPKDFLRYVESQGLGIKAINIMASLNLPHKMEEFLWFYQNGFESETLNMLCRFTTSHKIKKYVSRQIANYDVGYCGYGESKEHHVAKLWKDYLEMCETLGYDRSKNAVLFPKNVRDEHDKLVQLVKVTYDPEVDAAIQKLYPVLEASYLLQDQDYLIRPPRDFDEFVQEGVSLLHCVCTNGFYKGHIKGTNLIFFIRSTKDPKRPFCTLEYGTKTQSIRQLQGYRDKGVPKEVRLFADLWLQKRCRTGNVSKLAAA